MSTFARRTLAIGALGAAVSLGIAGCGGSSPSAVKAGNLPVATDSQMAARVSQTAVQAHNGPTTVFHGTGTHTYSSVYIPGGNLTLTGGCLGGSNLKVAVGHNSTFEPNCPPKGVIGAAQDTYKNFPGGTYTVTVKAAPGEKWWISGFTKL
jgi:hypothetical protein